MSTASQSLAQLTRGLVSAPADILVRDVTLDSREVSPGALFLACPGRTHHGLRFAPAAVQAGASAVLYEESGAGAELAHVPPAAGEVFWAPVAELGRHAGEIADRFFARPSQSLTIAGITGTNGKTTCAWLLAQALRPRRRSAYMGTLGVGLLPSMTASERTTPDAVNVHRTLAALRDDGAEVVSMEVSSHAVDQHRVAGVRFHTAAFTNLTRDHLDYHGTMQAYGAAKARLFDWPSLVNRVVNIDDPFGAQLATRASAARLIVTCREAQASAGADYVRAKDVTPTRSGLELQIESSWGAATLRVPLIGAFNADNVLTVLAVLLAWEYSLPQAAAVLADCPAPVGRMEAFGGKYGPMAIVDYAHTPDALSKALRAARLHCAGKLRVVFGCGGDRDTGKRPLMGRIAAELADDIIVTDDNPRTEDPTRIVAEILTGMHRRDHVRIEHDRARAITEALQASGSDDVVLIAGKGHEDYQLYGMQRRDFRDQEVVKAALGGRPT